MNSVTQLTISEYFDSILNEIDIKRETLLRDEARKSTCDPSVVQYINNRSEELIDLVTSIKSLNIEKFDSQNGFIEVCFFMDANFINEIDARYGRLILIDEPFSVKELELLKELLFFHNNPGQLKIENSFFELEKKVIKNMQNLLLKI
jgi:hypothetical protein